MSLFSQNVSAGKPADNGNRSESNTPESINIQAVRMRLDFTPDEAGIKELSKREVLSEVNKMIFGEQYRTFLRPLPFRPSVLSSNK